MKFSIIVPVYNVEKYLERCLDSILNQEYQDYEVILVDDGSKDQSREICDRYSEKFSQIIVIHQENQGLSGARNTGLSAANGEWIVFVDSDDWIEDDMLQVISMQMKNEDADLYSFNVRKIDQNNQLLENLLFTVENDYVSFYTEEEKFNYFFYKLMQYKVGWEVWSRIYKKSIIEEHNLRFVSTQKIFAEDYLFTFQYMLYVNKIGSLCNIFYNYFQHSDSLLHSTAKASILPKLYRIGEIGYHNVCKEHMGYFRKNYRKLYFMLLNYHIQFSLQKLPKEILESNFNSMAKHRLHRKWIKQIKKEIDFYQEYMGIKKWL